MSAISSRRNFCRHDRAGAVVVLMALLMIPMLAMVAFAVDYGYLLKVETDLQRCADMAALAAVQDLVPADDGTQDLDVCRAAVRTYVESNFDPSFQVLDSDIEIGRYDPATIYTNVTLLNDGIFDAIRVTVRRDGQANGQVPLLFARALGINDSPVTATACAVLQKPAALPPGSGVIPFSIPEDVWDGRADGEQWSIYGDGKITDNFGAEIPGNWGTLDIGPTSNSTAALNTQILDGLLQSDLDALYGDGRIPQNTHIDATQPVTMQADTGLSSGLKHSVTQIHGETRIAPIYEGNSGASGNNLEFNVVKWGVVRVIDSTWQGTKNTNITIAKSYIYDGHLRPQTDLSDTTGIIEAAFTSPVLVE